MFIQQMIKAIAGGWKWIISIVLIAICISLTISALAVPTYRAQASFIIAPNKELPSSRDVVSAFTALDTLNIFSTYADILASERVYAEAIKAINLDVALLEVYTRRTEMKSDSIILYLLVEGPDAQTAATLANEVGKYGIQFINAYFSVFEIDFLDQAIAAGQPFKPRTLRDMGISAGIGLLVGMLLVLMKEIMQIPLAQFVHKFSIDAESLAFTKKHIQKVLVDLKEKNDAWPITFMLVKIKNLLELLEVLPAFSRRKLTSEVVARMKTQLKGGDLIGRWDDSTFCVVMKKTPQNVSALIAGKLLEIFREPFTFGVEDREQTLLEAIIASETSKHAMDFEHFVQDTVAKIAELEW